MRIRRGEAFALIILWILLSVLFFGALFAFRAAEWKEQDERLAAYARAEARALANLMEPAFAAAYAVGALLEETVDFEEIGDYARKVMERWPLIARVVVAPDGKVATLYPEGAADAVLGLDLFADPVRGSDSRLAMETKTLTMTGPYELKSGGLGLTARYPVFRRSPSGEDRFWGFAVTVVYLDKFLAAAGFDELEAAGYRWALSSVPVNPRDSRSERPSDAYDPTQTLYMHQVFAASRGGLPAAPVIVEVPFPNSSWLLAVAPENDRRSGRDIVIMVLLSVLASATVASLALSFVARARSYATAAKTLSAEVAQRRETEQKLRATVEEKETLLREIHHRVKNNLSIVESIVSLQAGEASGTRFEEVFSQLSKRVHSISLIHEKLYRGRDLDRVEARSYIRDLVDFIVDSIGTSIRGPEVAVDDLELTSKAALSVGLILTELCTNAFKYGDQGSVVVALVRDGDRLVLSVENSGPPPPANYRDGSGLGLRLVDTLAGQLGGSWRVEEGPPVRFTVNFPAAAAVIPT